MSYVQIHITDALLRLLERKNFADISVTDIVEEAGVGRASFYRKFTDKEDVIRQHLQRLIFLWRDKIEAEPPENWQLSLMEHYYEHRDFYLAINRAGLSNLQLENVISICGAKPEDSNLEAYFHSLLAYSVFGWIIEWMNRGMQETPEQVMALLSTLEQTK